MKKFKYRTVLLIITLAATAIVASSSATAARAADLGNPAGTESASVENEPTDIEAADILRELREIIPEDVQPFLPDELLDGESSAVDAAGSLGIDFVFGAIYKIIVSALTPASGFLSTILGALLISSALRQFSRDVSDGALADAASLITCLSLAVYTVTVMENLAVRIETFTGAISTFSAAMVPMMTAMLSASGNVTGAAVTSSGLLLFSSAMQYAIAYIFLPLFRIGLALSVVSSSVSGSDGVDSICSVVRRMFTWLAAGAATIYASVLAYQTQLAAVADSTASRTIRYAVSNAVPVVGGAIGDAIRTSASSLAVIKSGAGAIGIVVLILLSCPILITLFLTSASLGIGSAVAGILGCGGESTLLSELRSVTGLATAIVALSTAVFVFALSLFMKTAPALSA